MLEEELRQRDRRIQDLETRLVQGSPTPVPETPPPMGSTGVTTPSSEADAKRVRKMSSRYDEFAQPPVCILCRRVCSV